jgi:hypothetical protein
MVQLEVSELAVLGSTVGSPADGLTGKEGVRVGALTAMGVQAVSKRPNPINMINDFFSIGAPSRTMDPVDPVILRIDA